MGVCGGRTEPGNAVLQARLLTSARAVLLSAEEAETERRMTQDAEMKTHDLCSQGPYRQEGR